LSSTRSANHDRVESARDSAGQPLNRVFERHNIDNHQIRRKPVLNGLINEYTHAA
jgi:hypothetical protein